MQLRDYQRDLAIKGFDILKKFGIVYLSMEPRTGKTLTSFSIAELVAKYKEQKFSNQLPVYNNEQSRLATKMSVLFITKKKAISSIITDYNRFNFSFLLDVINFEQAERVSDNTYDLIIVDEAHSLGAYPKPSQRTQFIKKIVGLKPLILLSGTPTPESYSQMYHQLWISERSPFKSYVNFYKWAGTANEPNFVKVKKKMISGVPLNDYKNALQNKIEPYIKPLMLSFTQEEAGFNAEIEEEIRTVKINPQVKWLIKKILEEKYYCFPNGQEIIADSPVKVQSKVHQLCSGTVKFDDGTFTIMDRSKAEFIRENYGQFKIAVFYKFIAERQVLTEIFPNFTESPEDFNQSPDKVFISQVQSGSMGVNLSTADYILFYNIDFAAVLYYQARARSQSKDRKESSKIVWIFSEDGIEHKIYRAVQSKQNYTSYYFQRDYYGGKKDSARHYPVPETAGSLRGQDDRFEPQRSSGFVTVQ